MSINTYDRPCFDDIELIREDEITTTDHNKKEPSFNDSDLIDESDMEVMIASYSKSEKVLCPLFRDILGNILCIHCINCIV